ncbi:response regulator, partial [bacterium]|nr:response regulator [bacterium]
PGQATVMFSDVTERKKLEEQLLQSQKMESIGQLAGGVAHDFNNLLTGILGYSDLLMAQMQSDDSSYAAIQEIHKAGKRAASLTQQLLAFSRKQILEPKVINLNDLVNNLDKMLRRLIGENIEYKTQLEPALDPVKADPGKIEQIIMNLVVNARDAMPLGGRLWLETQNIMLDEAYCRHQSDCEPGNYVMLSVSDTGMGMDAETLNRAFDPFFTTKETGKGTGLGLSTVYGIVKQSNGHVAIYSEEKIGTTFKVFLPTHAVPIESSTNMADKEKENLKGTETILVVEDEKAVRDLLLHVLGQHGYTVFQARDCQQAFDLEQEYKESIHLILTDVVLPNKSGREIVEKVRQNRPSIQVLYMSGYTDDAIVQHGVLEEGLEFIQKPFETKRLLRKIREILDRK